MLSGIKEALQKAENPTALIQEIVLSHKAVFEQLPSVCGSFKNITPLEGNFAIAYVREKGNSSQEMLQKEGKLLKYMRSLGLPAINFYSDVFEINPDQYAVLIDWIPNANLLDSKAVDAVHNKLAAIILGISIPDTEAWALRKTEIDEEIRLKIEDSESILTHAQHVASKLHESLKKIAETIEINQCLIGDLQLIVTPDGQVSIIDPIDVVQICTENSQSFYQSILDMSIQNNSDFIRQLHDGKFMLRKCLSWCSSIMAMRDKKELLPFIFNASSTATDSMDLPNNFMLRQMLTKKSPTTANITGRRDTNTGKREAKITHRRITTTKILSIPVNARREAAVENEPVMGTAPVERKKSIELRKSAEVPVNIEKMDDNVLDDILNVITTSPHTSPKSSPKKGVLGESPSKILAWSFSHLNTDRSPRSKKCLFASETEEDPTATNDTQCLKSSLS